MKHLFCNWFYFWKMWKSPRLTWANDNSTFWLKLQGWSLVSTKFLGHNISWGHWEKISPLAGNSTSHPAKKHHLKHRGLVVGTKIECLLKNTCKTAPSKNKLVILFGTWSLLHISKALPTPIEFWLVPPSTPKKDKSMKRQF